MMVPRLFATFFVRFDSPPKLPAVDSRARELQNEIQRAGLPPSGFVFEKLAECLFIKNSHNEAKKYFRKAYEILSKDIWLKANAADRLQRLRELGE